MPDTCWNCGSGRMDDTQECRSCGLRLGSPPAQLSPDPGSTRISHQPPDEAARTLRPWTVTAPAPTTSSNVPPATSPRTPPVPSREPEPPVDAPSSSLPNPWSQGRARQPATGATSSSTGGPGRRVDVGDSSVAGVPPWLTGAGSTVSTGRPGPPSGAAPPLAGPPVGAHPPLPSPGAPSSGAVAPPARVSSSPSLSAPTTNTPRGSAPGTTTGYVHGQILEEGRERRFWGGRLLLGVCALALIAAVVTGGADLMKQVIITLMPLIVLAAVIAAIPMMMGKGGGVMGSMMQVGTGMARGAAGVARAGASGVRGSAGLLGRSGSSTFVLTVRRFRIQDVLGTTTSCILIGEVAGDLMRQGDLVRVEGRKNRDGVIRSRVVYVLDAMNGPVRTVVRAHLTFGFHVARAGDILAKVAAAGLALLTLTTLLAG